MRKKATSNKSCTDWARVDATKDEDIDLSDSPEITPEMFARALVRRGLKPIRRKSLLTVRLDDDILEWFRSQGPGYQTRINSLLRAYMEASVGHARSARRRARV
ncbi:MAG: BrnA antitoxin family protein [Acidobacteriota bacterium]